MAQKNLHRALQARREKHTKKTGEKKRKKCKEQVQEINIPPHPSITEIVLVI